MGTCSIFVMCEPQGWYHVNARVCRSAVDFVYGVDWFLSKSPLRMYLGWVGGGYFECVCGFLVL